MNQNMRKRERENPCGVCGHYHKYEEGEVCQICGHRMAGVAEKVSSIQVSAFPTEILPEFLYLGSYDNASRAELLKTQGISRVLNTVPAIQNLYKNSFTYFCLQDEHNLQFDDAVEFLEECERDRARVLVHCMTGKSRSPAIVMAYLMKSKGWKLAQCYQWVKERRPSVELTQGVYQQLQDYEQKVFVSVENSITPMPAFTPPAAPSFSFGFPKPSEPASAPTFNTAGATSIFSGPRLDIPPQKFTFGAGHTQNNVSQNPPVSNQNPSDGDISMDGS
nr:protein-tyrosine-phosphatase IBR5-like [Ipomoea batatas]GME19800.1 protein-tyrosine-phosphatase IBR5-like [Ipomoea batatas]